jgi:hypothetical protein
VFTRRDSGDVSLLKISRCSRHPIPEVIISAFGALYLLTGSLKLGPALTRSPRAFACGSFRGNSREKKTRR